MSDKKTKFKAKAAAISTEAKPAKPQLNMWSKAEATPLPVVESPAVNPFGGGAAPVTVAVVEPNYTKPKTLSDCFTRLAEELDPNSRVFSAHDLSLCLGRLAELFKGVE